MQNEATTTSFGVHVGLQHTTPAELIPLYRHIEDLGFDWISVWDHFYAGTGRPDDASCLEAVAMHAALACSTERVRCGALVYSVGYRHPAILAKAITTIDLLSGGRAEMGLGAGWAEVEYRAYGIDFPPIGTRMDQLDEGVRVLRSLLHDQPEGGDRADGAGADFSGDWFTLRSARNEPRPIQRRLPIWIGGTGERRTLPIAARHADGWNAPFVSPEELARLRGRLLGLAREAGRAPDGIRCAVNLGLAFTEDSLHQQFGALVERVRPGVLTGSDDEIVDRIGAYVDAGADQINLALRAPFDVDALDRFADLLGLAGRSSS